VLAKNLQKVKSGKTGPTIAKGRKIKRGENPFYVYGDEKIACEFVVVEIVRTKKFASQRFYHYLI